MSKTEVVTITTCGQCSHFSIGFLSEPSECDLFDCYTHFVKSNEPPPEWCPLDESNSEK